MIASAMTAETTSAIADSQERERIVPAGRQVNRAVFVPVYEHHQEVSSWQP
jgi:hypothetical protein